MLRSPLVVTAAVLAAGLLAASPSAQTPLKTELFTTNTVRPVFVTGAPGDSQRLFVVEQHEADIEIFIGGVKNGAPFLDLTGQVATGNEQGLLGLAFHPDYANNGYFFVYLTASGGGTSQIRRYQRSTADSANAGSALTVLSVGQPQPNHNGGRIAFSPIDGFLYIGFGDGGNSNDSGSGHAAGGNAQSLTTRLGKILRIDPSTDPSPSPAFSPPSSNPFFAMGFPANEVWDYGLRNTFNFSFDVNGDLYIADVGQDPFNAVGREEFNYHAVSTPGGLNFGWRCREGTTNTGLSGCTPGVDPLVDPVYHYAWGGGENQGQANVGGSVYRGDAIPDLVGTYLFADNSSEQIWSLRMVGGAVTELDTNREDELALAAHPFNSITGINPGPDGELYITQIGGGGKILKIVPDTNWTGLGFGTPGTFDKPILWGTGDLSPGSSGSVNLSNARQNAVSLLLISFSDGMTPVFGGTLIPAVPWNTEFFFNTGATGELLLPYASWPTLPSGFELYMQWLIDDPANPSSVAMSNALKGVIP